MHIESHFPSNAAITPMFCGHFSIKYGHPNIEKEASECCNNTDFCNEGLVPTFPPTG